MSIQERIARIKLYKSCYEKAYNLEYKQYYYNLIYAFMYKFEMTTCCIDSDTEYYAFIDSEKFLKDILIIIRKSRKSSKTTIDLVKEQICDIKSRICELDKLINNI